MKKYPLLASTLIAATALAVPAFANDEDLAFLATYGIMPLSGTYNTGTTISATNGASVSDIGNCTFNTGSTLLVDATSKWTLLGNLTLNSGSNLVLSVNVGEDGENSAHVIISGNYSVSISTGTSITLTIDISDLSDEVTEFTVGIISGGSYTFDDDTTASDLNLIAKFMDGDSEDTSWDYYSVAVDGNGLSLVVSRSTTAIPEPSMFGILFGLGAIGLVATRRRKRA